MNDWHDEEAGQPIVVIRYADYGTSWLFMLFLIVRDASWSSLLEEEVRRSAMPSSLVRVAASLRSR